MNWLVLKQLHQIYEEGKTKSNKILLKDPEILFLLNSTKELYLVGDFIIKKDIFDKYYETHRLDNFHQYREFLQKNNLDNPQARFKEKDIKILIDIDNKMQNKNLNYIKKQVGHKAKLEYISQVFFGDKKYLFNQVSLTNAVIQLIRKNDN